MSVTVVTPAVQEPLSLSDAKLFLRVDTSIEDTLIALLLSAARSYAENLTRRAFVQRTLDLKLPNWPVSQIIELPYPPLRSVAYVKYVDFDGNLQTLDPSTYQIDYDREPALIKPAFLSIWPVLTRNDFNMVQVRYTAGYAVGGSPDDYTANVPEPVKQWMKMRISTLYANREAVIIGTIVAELEHDFVDGLLDEFMVSVF